MEGTALGRIIAKVAVARAVYTIDRPYDYLVGEELAFDQRLPVYYGYTAHDELCQSLMALTRETFGPHPSQVHPVGAVIGTHVGPGAVAVAFFCKSAKH